MLKFKILRSSNKLFQNSIYSSTIQSLKWDLENAHEIAFILTSTLKEETFAKA